MNKTKRQESFYDEFYKINNQPGAGRIKDFFFNRFIKKSLENQKGYALEIGCGDGILTGYLLEKKIKVTGIDISAKGIDVLKNRYKEGVKRGLLKAICGDVIKYMNSTGNKYDFVIGSGIIHHIPKEKWSAFFGGVFRVLKKGGIFSCGPEPGVDLYNSIFWRFAPFFYNKVFKIPYDEQVEKGTFDMKYRNLAEALEKAGFTSIEILPYQVIPHFNIKQLALIDRNLVNRFHAKFAAYIIVKAVK